MSDFLLYIIEISISLFLFYSVFWIFLKSETYFRINRYYITLTLFLSLYPCVRRDDIFYLTTGSLRPQGWLGYNPSHLIFKLLNATRTSIMDIIQNRITIFGSFQPLSSKWWWMGAILNTLFFLSLYDPTCRITENTSIMNTPPMMKKRAARPAIVGLKALRILISQSYWACGKGCGASPLVRAALRA